MLKLSKPHIHLWLYNNPFSGVADQVEFFLAAFKQAGYQVTVGKNPSLSALNVVIENFSCQTRDILLNFCSTYHKRVAIIMTEHLDLNIDNGELFIHGESLHTENDYMHPTTQLARIQHLMECLPFIRCFFILGDLPILQNITNMFSGIPLQNIPFPKIPKMISTEQKMVDLAFVGFITKYRNEVFDQIIEQKISFCGPKSQFLSRKRRHLLHTSTKIVLNIPQRKTWPWLSSMRIIAALRSGCATVSLGTNDKSQISKCCIQLDIENKNWATELQSHVLHWEHLYQSIYEKYHAMAKKYEEDNPFPHNALYFWSITELTRNNMTASVKVAEK